MSYAITFTCDEPGCPVTSGHWTGDRSLTIADAREGLASLGWEFRTEVTTEEHDLCPVHSSTAYALTTAEVTITDPATVIDIAWDDRGD